DVKTDSFAYGKHTVSPPKKQRRLVTSVPSTVRPCLRALRFTTTKAVTAAVRPPLKFVPGTSRQFGPPRGFSPSLKAYAETRRDGSASFVELYPRHDVTRKLPIVVPAKDGGEPIRSEFLSEEKSSYPAAGVGIIDG